ncbi:MAG: diacylglycerol kinase family protein [Parcubacteria group bacterium]
MYYYVYDSLALAKESSRVTTKIETEINNLGLSGERGQVSALRSVEDLVKDAARRGYQPIVAVGDDATFNTALNALVSNKAIKQIPLGYIPITANQPMAQLLGLDSHSAVVALSRRIIRTVPLAQAGKAYFLSVMRCQPPEPIPRSFFDRLLHRAKPIYQASISVDHTIRATIQAKYLAVHYDPKQTRLRIDVRGARFDQKGEPQDLSVMWGSHITIAGNPQLACLIDGRPVTRTPIDVSVSNVRIPLIVGRSRKFE